MKKGPGSFLHKNHIGYILFLYYHDNMGFFCVFQIYDMILVRHGLMIVGDPLAGKTSSFKVLSEALGDLHEQGLMEEFGVSYICV